LAQTILNYNAVITVVVTDTVAVICSDNYSVAMESAAEAQDPVHMNDSASRALEGQRFTGAREADDIWIKVIMKEMFARWSNINYLCQDYLPVFAASAGTARDEPRVRLQMSVPSASA